MTKIIANKKVSITQEEYNYYLELEKAFGKESFLGLFQSDKEGMITAVTPPVSQPTAMILVFFFLNLMHNQKLRKLEPWISKLEKLEERITELERMLNSEEVYNGNIP